MAALAAEEVAASAGFFGGATKATIIHLVGKNGLYGSQVLPGIGMGAAATIAGALTMKGFSDEYEKAHELRLSEVRSHARLIASPRVALGPAMRQLLTSFNWCLSVEGRRSGGLSGASGPLNLAPFFGGGNESGDGDVSVGGNQRAIEKEMRRQVRRIWKLCDQQPPRSLPKGRPGEGMGQKIFPRKSTKTKGRFEQECQTEAYDKLFNPQHNSVNGDRGLCAALCYLIGAFIRHRKMAPGGLQDGSRVSLRLAVAALARHQVFDEELPEKDESGESSDIVEFRRGALALLPLLDAALAWKPVDPWGWFGNCEDDAPMLVAHTKGICSFPALAARLKKSLNKAASGDTVTWRRLSVHLDSIRVRDLPHPWSWIWVQAQDASMLVRNHTKVPLRVELHRPAAAKMNPWADWPIINALISLGGLLRSYDDHDPLIIAEVGPGVEWAMRPKAREGRHFEMKLMTEQGVIVCSKRLRRGQTFDFHVNVPARNRPVMRRAIESGNVRAAKAGEKELDEDDQSVCSTAAPSSLGPRLSVASSTASTTAASVTTPPPLPLPAASGIAPSRARAMRGIAETPPLASPANHLDAAICPRCLREMRARFTRPTAATYAEGVACDRCSDKILEVEVSGGHSESNVAFFHCRRCWFDLCQKCALKDMQDVWWCED